MILLVLRPQVGAEATAARIRAAGHQAVTAPLFTYRALPWEAPPAEAHDAVMLTSAAAARLGGEALRDLRGLPVHVVGTATGAAARAAGFADVAIHLGDARTVVDALAAAGLRRVLHLGGRDHIVVAHPQMQLHRIPIYAADAVTALPAAAATALDRAAVALLHSPRAARTFAALLGQRDRADIRIGCFSEAVAQAAGPGWGGVAVAEQPVDDALLAAVSRLCDQEPVCNKGPAC